MLCVERVALIYLHADILNAILAPQLKLCLGDEHQGKRDFVHDHVNVLLDHFASGPELKAYLHSFEGSTESLGTHEFLTLCENDG